MADLIGTLNSFIKKDNSTIVIDLNSGLRIYNIEQKPELKIISSKPVALGPEKRGKDIVNAIQAFLQEHNIQHKKAILNPCLDSLVIKRFSLPAMPYSELPEAIRWNLKEGFGPDYAGALLDFLIIKEFTKDSGAKALDILCAAAKYDEVKEQVLWLKEAGLDCVAVIPPAFGYAKIADKFLKQDRLEPQAVIHLDEYAAFIAIYEGKRLEFYRNLPVDISKLREALSTTLGTERGVIKLSKEDIQGILFEYGFSTSADALYKDKISANEVLSMLRSSFERLAQEIKRSLAYYRTQFQGAQVNRVFLSGLGADIPGIDKFISQESGLNIQKIAIGFPNEDICDLGLSLDPEHNISLLPKEFRAEKFERIQKTSLRWVSFVAFLLMIVLYLFGLVRGDLLKKRLDNSSVQLNILSEIKQIKEEQETLSGLIAQTRSKEMPIAAFLKFLSAVTGPEVHLRDVFLQLNAKTGSIEGFISASAGDSQDILSKYVEDLEASPYILDVTVTGVSKNQEEASHRFNLDLKLK